MRGRSWLAGFVVMCTLVAGAWPAARQSGDATTGTWTADFATSWRGDDGRARVQLHLRTNGADDRWGFGVRPEDLQGLPADARSGVAANVRFRLVREAGTFTLTGSFDDGRGSGQFTFAPDAAYVRAMDGFGYRDLTGARLMRLAVLDVSTAFIRELREAGQTAPPLDDLVRFRIHGVTGPLVRAFAQAGLANLAPDDLVRLRIHGATPEFLAGLRQRGYTGLDADDLTRMRIHGVTLDGIDALAAAGMRGVAADALVRFRIHGVSPAFVRDMRGLGFTNADADDFVRMRIHRVTAALVRDARADGLEVATADDAVELAIHGRRWTRGRRRCPRPATAPARRASA